jgi:hypothetical protein
MHASGVDCPMPVTKWGLSPFHGREQIDVARIA